MSGSATAVSFASVYRSFRDIAEFMDWEHRYDDIVDMMTEATAVLTQLESKGYFGFMRQGAYVVDQVVTSFSEQDVKQLGDNVVLILNTVKALNAAVSKSRHAGLA